MANIQIFVDEDIIRKYISEVLNLNFSNLRIEEIIEITKSAKYRDFSNAYKINSLRKPTINTFRVEDNVQKEINAFLVKKSDLIEILFPNETLGKIGDKISFK